MAEAIKTEPAEPSPSDQMISILNEILVQQKRQADILDEHLAKMKDVAWDLRRYVKQRL